MAVPVPFSECPTIPITTQELKHCGASGDLSADLPDVSNRRDTAQVALRAARSSPRFFLLPCSPPCSDAPQRSHPGGRSCPPERATCPPRSSPPGPGTAFALSLTIPQL